MLDLLMERYKVNTRINIFPGSGTQSDNLKSRRVDLISQLIDGNIGGCANQDLAHFLLN